MAEGRGPLRVLCHISMAPVPARELIPAAAAAGFDGVSIVARAHRRFLSSEGITDADLRTLFADHGLVVTDFEAVGDWLAPPPADRPPHLRSVYTGTQCLDAAEAVGARTLVATHFGEPIAAPQAAHAFARLCDRAAERGLQVALEFPAMATIADVTTAWDVVRLADRPNGGILLDTWHHRRSPATDTDLAAVPAERIMSIQLRDGAAEPVGPPVEDVLIGVLPGDGDFGLADLVGSLLRRGVTCPVGVEVLSGEILTDGPPNAAEILYRSLARVLDDAQATPLAAPSR
jgi:sugar phosphate isomerase/epimerase